METVLGRDTQTGEPVAIRSSARSRGVYCIGSNGTGKTNLLLSMILSDISQGMGVCVLDPHGDLTNDIIHRLPASRVRDVILLDPLDTEYPFGLNLFACSDPSDTKAVEHSVNQIVQVFEKVFGMSVFTPRLNQFVRNIAYTLVGTDYTMVEIPHLLLDKAFRDKVLVAGRPSSKVLFWSSYDSLRPNDQLERAESTLDRIDSLISSPIIRNIVGQSKTTINFRAIMDEGKILLVQLPARYESLTSLLGSIIIGQILTAALSRATVSTRRSFSLVVDEYQRFATPDMATLLQEARKFNVCTVLCHQTLSQIDEKNKAAALQAGTLVVFKVNGDDAKELSSSFDCTPPPPLLDKREKVLTLAEDVVGHLFSLQGYANPVISSFVEKWLRRLDKRMNQQRISEKVYNHTRREYETEHYPPLWEKEHIRSILYDKLNPIFSAAMKQRNYNQSIPPSLLSSIRRIPEFSSMDNAEFLRDLEAFLRTIVREPLMVDSGEWEMRPGTQRTYNDMQNEIATTLANLPIYTAHVKIEGSEHTIRTLPPSKDIWIPAFIQSETRKHYCRLRKEVEEEIAARVTVQPSQPKRGTFTI